MTYNQVHFPANKNDTNFNPLIVIFILKLHFSINYG